MNTNRSKHIDVAYVVIRDIFKNWLSITCVAISAALIAYMIAYVCYVPKYTSSCTMIVSAKENSTGTYTDTNKTENLTDTLKAVLSSSILKAKTAEAMGNDAFEGKIAITVIPNTNLMEISVTSANPYNSFLTLKTMLEIHPEISHDVLGEIVMDIFEEPSFPSSPSNAFIYENVIRLSLIIAAGVVILIVAIYSYLSNTVKTEWDATEKLDTKLLGVLFHEGHYRNLKARILRKKKRLLMGTPAISFGFCETIKKIRTNIHYFQEKHGGKVLLITSYDKKEGKTTIAANLAVAIAQRKQRVLLIPGTPSSDLLDILNIQLPSDFLTNKTELSDMVYTKEDSTLSIFANTKSNRLSENTADAIAYDKFRVFIDNAKNIYDYIIIDGPCAKSSANAEIFATISDFSLLVVAQNRTKVPFVNDTIDMLNSYNGGLAGCVYNNVYSSTSVINVGYGYGYGGKVGYGFGKYGRYGKYGGYGKYGNYGKYGSYGSYGGYGGYGKHGAHYKQKSKRDKK